MTVTVWFNGNALIISKAVAKLHNLTHGSTIPDESKFWAVLADNAAHNIAAIKPMVDKNEN